MADLERPTILPLLRKLSTAPDTVDPSEITSAITHIFHGSLTPVQTGALLTALHYTRLDTRADIIAAAAWGMRSAGLQIPGLAESSSKEDSYEGGLVDIVGTGGDGHDTFNVSTTAAVLAAGCGLHVCKHGNKASTSTSGSADLLTALGAKLLLVTPDVVRQIFTAPAPGDAGTFCFLYAPIFHPSMSHVAPIRRELGCRTIFNLLGPLVNPIDYSLSSGLEARIIGVGKISLGRVFAETLRLLGVRRAMVVCGAEELDEISIAGETHCWRLEAGEIQEFRVHPQKTFGVECHALREVAGGKSAAENGAIFEGLMKGQDGWEAVRDYVLVNTAALLVVAKSVEGEEKIVDGVAVGSRWTNAVEKCRSVLKSGEAWTVWEGFREASRAREDEVGRM